MAVYLMDVRKEGLGPESLRCFLDACRGEAVENAADAELGLLVVQTIEAMYKSAMSGAVESI